MLALLFFVLLAADVEAQFSAADKAEILQAHNTLRSQIALGNFIAKDKKMPAAADMLKMVWSSTVEASAQAVADTCVFQHSNSGYGENLYKAWSSATNTITGKGKTASERWAKEFQDYGWSSVYFNMTVFNSGVGHATQMAWAKSGQIGCGAKLCGATQNEVLVVCQYNPAGNMLNSYTYTQGTACSKCPTGKTCEAATGLCI